MWKSESDIGPWQCAISHVTSYLYLSHKNETVNLTYTVCSVDLTPVDFLLFPKLKTFLKRHYFQIINKTEENIIPQLHTTLKNTLQEAFQKCKKCGKDVLSVEGVTLKGIDIKKVLIILIKFLLRMLGLFCNYFTAIYSSVEWQ